MRAGWGLCLVVTACGRIGFEPPASVDAVDSTVDSTVFAEPCVDGPTAQSFISVPCAPWGIASMTNGAVVGSGAGGLVFDPGRSGVSYAGCQFDDSLADVDFARGGFFDVASTTNAAAQTAYNAVHFYHSSIDHDYAFVIERGDLIAYSGPTANPVEVGRVPFDILQRLLRWRPSGSQMIAETSTDGQTWFRFAVVTDVIPTFVRPNVGAGTNGVESNPGTFRARSFNVCP